MQQKVNQKMKQFKKTDQLKLYNVIFPIWFMLFIPPIIIITLIGNFVIDSLVLIACFFLFELAERISLKEFYTAGILKVWLFGFLADIAGAAILFVFGIFGNYLGLPHDLISAIDFDPFSNPLAVVLILFAMLVSAALIFLLNYNITFKEQIKEKNLRLKIALTLALVTMPWTFLLPTKWFYYSSLW